MPPKRTTVPTTILTGYLGSGKTTLLNRILSNKKGLKIAVIENEFGAVDVDGALLEDRNKEKSEDEIVEMMNGCICCTVRADLQVLLKRLLITEKRKLDAIIIETTGLADPAPVAQTFFVDEELAAVCHLDAIITMVDAAHIDQQLSRERPEDVENEAEEQLAFADKIILNKLDLVPDRAKVEATKARLRGYNPTAEIIEATNSEVAADRLMGLDAFNLKKVMEVEPDFLDTGAEHKHDSTVTSFCVQSDTPVVQMALENWISGLLKDLGTNLFRYKGILSVMGMDRKFVFQGVHMLFQGNFTSKWKADEKRTNRFVFIGRDLPIARLEAEFQGLYAKELRFPVGATVQASVGTFKAATVIKHWDEGNAYRLRLANGEEVWAPVDEDDFIREGPGSGAKRGRGGKE